MEHYFGLSPCDASNISFKATSIPLSVLVPPSSYFKFFITSFGATAFCAGRAGVVKFDNRPLQLLLSLFSDFFDQLKERSSGKLSKTTQTFCASGNDAIAHSTVNWTQK